MTATLSDADLRYCVDHHIVSKSDSLFLTLARNRSDVSKLAREKLNDLSGKLSYYSGIAAKSDVMKQQTALRSKEMRKAKEQARIAYSNHNKPGSGQTV